MKSIDSTYVKVSTSSQDCAQVETASKHAHQSSCGCARQSARGTEVQLSTHLRKCVRSGDCAASNGRHTGGAADSLTALGSALIAAMFIGLELDLGQ